MARSSFFLLLWSMFAVLTAGAQSQYIVRFKDKNGTSFSINSPEQFLSQRAIDRRARQGISVTTADFPVNPSYVQQLRSTGARVFFTSRWMNCALVQADDAQIQAISNLSTVVSHEFVAPGAHAGSGGRIKEYKNRNGSGIAAPTMGQLSMVGIDTMHMDGLRGEGIFVAMFDSGYPGVNTAVPFQHLFQEDRIQYTYDFVGAGTNVYRYDEHGTQVFSVIAGHSDTYTGGAYKATFQLYVTEADHEYRIEEYNWLFAAERADSSGVDLISASLGYNTFDDESMDYPKSALDGLTAIVSRAAAAAIERGIVVVCSAGNEGNNSWELVTPPADVNGILAVGSVTAGGTRSGFSSIGPTADKRIKPDVVAMGSSTTIVRPSGSVGTISGTSVAAPIISSLAAGVMQRFPSLSAKDIQSIIVASGSQSSTPDNLLGYGIPFYPRIVKTLSPDPGDEPIEIYPNPTANGKFQVLLATVNQDVEVQIFDLRGTVLGTHLVTVTWQNNPFELDLSSLAAGSYLVKVKTKDNFKTTTLIRQ